MNVPNSEFTLEKVDNQNLYIRYKDADFDVRLGKVIWDNNFAYDCYRKQLPDELSKKLYSYYRFGL